MRPAGAAAAAAEPPAEQFAPPTPWLSSAGPPPSQVHTTTIRQLARIIVAALVVVVIIDVWQIVAELHRASVASKLMHDPVSVPLGQARSADHGVQAAAIAFTLGLLVAGVLFISWLYQLVSSVRALRPYDVRHGRGWAIGGWFVPILNWFRPKQMVDDAWRGTRPSLGDVPRVPAFVHLWWALFLANGLFTSIATRLPTDTLHDVVVHDHLGAAADAVNIVAAVFAVLLVVRLTRRAYDGQWQQPQAPSQPPLAVH